MCTSLFPICAPQQKSVEDVKSMIPVSVLHNKSSVWQNVNVLIQLHLL